jgi:hypothetical protein
MCLLPLLVSVSVRNVRLYWTKSAIPAPWIPGATIGETFMFFYNKHYRPDSDPYDMTIAWKDFEKRADIAREFADRYVNKDDFIDPDNQFVFSTEEDVELQLPVPPQLETC